MSSNVPAERKVGWSKIPPPKESVDNTENPPRTRFEPPTFPVGTFDVEPASLSPARKSMGELQFARRTNTDIPQSPLVRTNSERTLADSRPAWKKLVPRSPRSPHTPKQQEVKSPQTMKRAVLIGIDYSTTADLATSPGNAKDISLLHDLLVFQFGFKSNQIWVLTDEPRVTVGAACRFRPTRALIINAMEWLISNSRRGEQLLFSFSGYGRSHLKGDNMGDYQDRECIIPSDYPFSSPITGKEIHNKLVRELADGATLLALFNCEDSSTIMGLPYVYSPLRAKNGTFRTYEELDAEDVGFSTSALVMSSVLRMGRLKKEMQLQQKHALNKRNKLAAACFDNGTVVCLTITTDPTPVSKSWQSSKHKHNLIACFIRFVKLCASQKEAASYNNLLSTISSWMHATGGPILPKLSSSHKFGLESTVSLLQG